MSHVLKCENFTKISLTRIQFRIQIRKNPRAESGSGMTLQVGSGSEINSFGSATLPNSKKYLTNNKAMLRLRIRKDPKLLLDLDPDPN